MATLNQTKVFDKVVNQVRKGAKVSVSGAMREVGYSKRTSEHPDKITESEGWKELMRTHLPDKSLAELHKKFLKKEEAIVISDGAQSGSHIEWTTQPHPDALKALDIAYKLKGNYPKEADGGNKTLIVVIAGESANRFDVSSDNKRISTA